MSLFQILLDLALVLAAAWAMGALAEKMGQPAVVGELLGGVLLALGLRGVFKPDDPVLSTLAHWGVLLLLFRAGMESDWKGLKQAGPAAMAVALCGMLLPFLLGSALVLAWGYGGAAALFTGAALTATSVGVTVRVLLDLDCLHLPESEIILGAAVIDDVLALLLLLFLPGASFGGFGIVAAFALGLWLSARGWGKPIAWLMLPLEKRLAPFFFVMAGAQMGTLPPGDGLARTLLLCLLLTAAAVFGKLASGWAARGQGLNRWAIGVGMVPRGEVGLIFAQAGLAAQSLGASLYAALLGMIAFTTLLAPLWLKKLLR